MTGDVRIPGIAWRTRRAPLIGMMAASAFGQLGNAIAALALPWFVLSLTGNPMWVGAAAATGTIALVCGSLFGGPLVGRFGGRTIAVTADLASAASMALIPVLFLSGHLSMALLLLIIALGSLIDGPGIVGRETHYPELARLARMPLERATSIDEIIDNGAVIFGPPVAGVAITLIGMVPTLWITAACSFAAALLSFVSLPRRSGSARPAAQDVLAGARFLLGEPRARALLLVATPVIAVFGALTAVVLPVFFGEAGRSAGDLGSLLAATGLAATLSAIAFARWGAEADARAVGLFGLIGFTLGSALLAAAPATYGLLIAGGMLGLAAGPIGPLVRSTILRVAPGSVRSSVVGATVAVALAASPVAALLSGAALDLAGPDRHQRRAGAARRLRLFQPRPEAAIAPNLIGPCSRPLTPVRDGECTRHFRGPSTGRRTWPRRSSPTICSSRHSRTGAAASHGGAKGRPVSQRMPGDHRAISPWSWHREMSAWFILSRASAVAGQCSHC